MSKRMDILTRLLYINAFAGLIYMLIFPIFKENIATYLIEKDIFVDIFYTSMLGGIAGIFDYFGLISIFIYVIITLILNYLFFTKYKGIYTKRLVSEILSLIISISLYTVLFLFLKDIFVPFKITTAGSGFSASEILYQNNYTILPIIFMFIWLDYLFSFLIIPKDIIIDERDLED